MAGRVTGASAGCGEPSRSFVDVDPQLVVDAAECLGLGVQTRRARPKSCLRRPPRAWRRPSERSAERSLRPGMRLCGRAGVAQVSRRCRALSRCVAGMLQKNRLLSRFCCGVSLVSRAIFFLSKPRHVLGHPLEGGVKRRAPAMHRVGSPGTCLTLARPFGRPMNFHPECWNKWHFECAACL